MSWNHGLCSCCAGGCGTACVGLLFPCVLVGKTAEAIGQGSCFGYGLLSCLFPCAHIAITASQRTHIREKEGIDVSFE